MRQRAWLSAVLTGALLALVPVVAAAQLLLTGAGGAGIVYSSSPGALILSDTQIGTASATTLKDGGGATVADSKTVLVAWREFGIPNFTTKSGAVNTNTLLLGPSNTGCENSGQGLCEVGVDNSAGFPAQLNFNDGSGLSGAAHNINFAQNGALVIGQWNTFIAAVSTATGHQVRAMYINGALSASQPAVTADMLVSLSQANGFHVLNGGTTAGMAYMDDVVLSTDDVLCTSSSPITVNGTSYNCTGANTIPAAILAHYTDPASGRAVDIGTDGSKFTGAQPCVFLNGGAAGMATNKGFCQGIALRAAQGSGATHFALADAPFGPGQGNTAPTSKPTQKWIVPVEYAQFTDCNHPTATDCRIAVNTSGQPVVAGELLAAVVVANYTTASITINPPDGTWACTGGYSGATDRTSATICTKIATDATNSWTFTYTASGSVASIGFELLDYVGASAFDVQFATAKTTRGTTWATGTGTLAVAGETVVDTWVNYDNATGVFDWTAWTGGTMRYRTRYGSGVDFLTVERANMSSGAFGSLTATNAASTSGMMLTFSVKP